MITPTEELELREYAQDAWHQTWDRVTPPPSPQQAFVEGHYLGMACGVLACRQTRMEWAARLRRLETRNHLLWVLVASLAAVLIAVVSR